MHAPPHMSRAWMHPRSSILYRQVQALAVTITKRYLDERKRNLSCYVNQWVTYWIEREDPEIPRKLGYSWSTPHSTSEESPLHYYMEPVESPSAVLFKVHVDLLHALYSDFKDNTNISAMKKSATRNKCVCYLTVV
jgi:hypothetical protein